MAMPAMAFRLLIIIWIIIKVILRILANMIIIDIHSSSSNNIIPALKAGSNVLTETRNQAAGTIKTQLLMIATQPTATDRSNTTTTTCIPLRPIIRLVISSTIIRTITGLRSSNIQSSIILMDILLILLQQQEEEEPLRSSHRRWLARNAHSFRLPIIAITTIQTITMKLAMLCLRERITGITVIIRLLLHTTELHIHCVQPWICQRRSGAGQTIILLLEVFYQRQEDTPGRKKNMAKGCQSCLPT
mmetsp:Transcript_32410/g.59473  ORF Transcript_32410/g.59473 Transcript_32410/m.59473 type:complete len:246 (-) Transcript_32410:935-1672(-)